MNLSRAIASLMNRGAATEDSGRSQRGPRLDRQTTNDFNWDMSSGKDNRLDKLPSFYEDQSYYDEETGEVYPDRQTFLDLLDPVKFEGGQQMPKGRPQDYTEYHSASGGRKTPTHSDYAGTSGLNQFSVNDPMFEQIMGLIAGAEGGVGGDGSINFYDKMLNAMKGRDMSPQDILSTLSDGSMRGLDASQMDPNALVEAALADKVNQMMENSGMLPGAKNQSRIGGGDFPRRKSGKGEQKVRRKLKGQADKGDRDRSGDYDSGSSTKRD